MKRRLCLLVAAAALTLGGCRGPAANWSDLERLRPVQVLGFDRASDGTVTASGAFSGKKPMAARGEGESIETALTALQNVFPEAEPYYAHVQYLIVGPDAAAGGMQPWLDWMLLRPEMRLDAAVYVARGGAAPLILSASGTQSGTAEKMESLETEMRTLGQGYAVSVRTLSAALAERGAGICCAVRTNYEAATGTDGRGIKPDGFAVFSREKLLGFLEQENAAGVLLALGHCEGVRVAVDGRVMTLQTGSVRAKRDGGTVTLQARLKASVAEGAEDEADLGALEQALAEDAVGWLRMLAEKEQLWDADFLNLAAGGSPAQTDFRLTVDATVDRDDEGRIDRE